jgi:quercetin 2,3-dioxygenase
MLLSREVKKIITGVPATDGAGVKLVRVLGYADTTEFDPFLLLDAFDSTNPDDYTKGFPWHPHRGIETITYLIEGDIEHQDSLGNKGQIKNGDCQWMTAGSGIIHQEMPQKADRMLGAQLWLNLPAIEKMTTPSYGDIKSKDVPEITKEDATVRIISGEYQGIKGAFAGKHVAATYLDVQLKPGASWFVETKEDENLVVYIFTGQGLFGSAGRKLVQEKRAILFTPGNHLQVVAGEEGIRFILLKAKPLKEPIAWGGPIVMNTKEELSLAFAELEEDTFIKK